MRRGRIALDDLDFGVVHMRENLAEVAHHSGSPDIS
jgi:hypothetical protein